MEDAVVTLFTTASCSVCRKLEDVLTAKGVRFRALDVGADRDALVLLLRYAGRPIVPTLVAFGEVMVGFDAARLEQLLGGLAERAESYIRRSAEEDAQIRESAAALDAAERAAHENGEP
jgi:glutaredoxin